MFVRRCLVVKVLIRSVYYASRVVYVLLSLCCVFFFFQAEDGIRDLVRSRGLGDVYKRQGEAQPRLERDDILARALPAPHLAAPGDDEPDLLDRAMRDCARDLPRHQLEMRHLSLIHI